MIYGDLQTKTRPIINKFGGINTGIEPLNVGDGEATDMMNLSSDHYPALSQRQGREPMFADMYDIKYFGKLFDNTLFCIARQATDGNAGVYWWNGSAWGTVTTPMAVQTILNNGTYFDATIFTDEYTYVSTGTGYFTIEKYSSSYRCINRSSMPEEMSGTYSTYVAMSAGHLMLAGNADAELRIGEWRKVAFDDAYEAGTFYIETAAGEYGAGICTFGDYVMYFKRNSINVLSGTFYENYQVNSVSDVIGCVSHRSLKEVGDFLFWLGADGVYACAKDLAPYRAGNQVQRYINNISEPETAAAGTDGVKYYLSIKQTNNTWVLLVFDTKRGTWHVEDNPGFTCFVYLAGDVYGCTETEFYKLNAGGDNYVEWSFTSKPFNFGQAASLINLHKIYLDMTIDEGASITASYSNRIDGDNFIPLSKYFTVGNGKIMFPIAPSVSSHNIKCFRIKLSGIGSCIIHGIEVGARVKNKAY